MSLVVKRDLRPAALGQANTAMMWPNGAVRDFAARRRHDVSIRVQDF
jgi:hypothetical protein